MADLPNRADDQEVQRSAALASGRGESRQLSLLTVRLLQAGFWLPWLLCTYLALTPSPPDPVFRISDVIMHGVAFSYLTFALGLAHHGRRWVPAAAWMLAYAILIELIQMLTPERTAQLKDVLVDAMAIGLGAVALSYLGAMVESWVVAVVEFLSGKRGPSRDP